MIDRDREAIARVRLHLGTLHHGELAERLVARFGSAADVFTRPRRELVDIEGMTGRALERLLSAATARLAEGEVRRAEREGIRVLLSGREGWPPALIGLPQMPLVLFVRGGLEPRDTLSVGVIGSRRPSPYGMRQARRFAEALSGWGVAVVSGLARGIDGAAQQAALDAGGRTIAVLGSGLGRIYPPEHARLAARIVGGRGAVISEFPFDSAPRSFHFPQRNRLLSGLSALLLVIEAGERSGSLITVDWALRQGKSVWVLPGRIDQPQALGALKLLRDGASPALAPEDLAFELGVTAAAAGAEGKGAGSAAARTGSVASLPGPLGEGMARLFEEEDAWHADHIAARLEVEPSVLLAELARLEAEGHLLRDASGAYVRG